MNKTLVIIESAGKIKKLQHILGNQYVIKASLGHIIDLDPKNMSIDFTDNKFEPTYKPINGKEKVDFYLNSLLKENDNPQIGEMFLFEGKKYKFTVPFNDIGEAKLLEEDKSVYFARWIRESMKTNEFLETE